MPTVVRVLAVVAISALLAAARAADPGSVVARTWQTARAGIPAGIAGRFAIIGTLDEPAMREALAGVDAGERTVPAVIVAHGCAGISGEERTLLYLLTLQGMAVFVPDSFARAGRRSQCDVDNASAVVDPAVYAQREEEIAYARARVGELDWVDPRRVFLLGVSEGGAAAATHAAPGFAGVVILGWHCGGRSVNSGLLVPPDTPVLAVVMEDDPWYQPYRGRHCGERFGARPVSRSLILPGSGHAVLHGSRVVTGERVKRELLGFFNRVAAYEEAAAGGGG